MRLRAKCGILIGLCLVVAATANAELTQRGDLFIRFDGGISPQRLPRTAPTSIAVRIEGTIRVPRRHRPPALRMVKVALNRGGRLSSQGLPTCSESRIESTTPPRALAKCGPALVGGGGFTARTSIVGQAPETVPGEILFFNTRVHGHPAILAQLFQKKPVPLNRLVVFHIRHTGGTFGTVLTGYLPLALNRNGYLKSIYLSLHRDYALHGRRRGYVMASCPAPPGVSVVSFPFARASMGFADGRVLSSILTRTCKPGG